eukprot:365136-Chlamydomonas_euryale.AAC.1
MTRHAPLRSHAPPPVWEHLSTQSRSVVRPDSTCARSRQCASSKSVDESAALDIPCPPLNLPIPPSPLPGDGEAQQHLRERRVWRSQQQATTPARMLAGRILHPAGTHPQPRPTLSRVPHPTAFQTQPRSTPLVISHPLSRIMPSSTSTSAAWPPHHHTCSGMAFPNAAAVLLHALPEAQPHSKTRPQFNMATCTEALTQASVRPVPRNCTCACMACSARPHLHDAVVPSRLQQREPFKHNILSRRLHKLLVSRAVEYNDVGGRAAHAKHCHAAPHGRRGAAEVVPPRRQQYYVAIARQQQCLLQAGSNAAHRIG